MALGSSMLATMRTEPPQWMQVFTSMLKTRLGRCAQVIARRRFSSGLRWSLLASVDASSVGGRLPRPDRVSCARHVAFGAKTPWKRVRWARGGGTSAASKQPQDGEPEDRTDAAQNTRARLNWHAV